MKSDLSSTVFPLNVETWLGSSRRCKNMICTDSSIAVLGKILLWLEDANKYLRMCLNTVDVEDGEGDPRHKG